MIVKVIWVWLNANIFKIMYIITCNMLFLVKGKEYKDVSTVPLSTFGLDKSFFYGVVLL